jgi:hypothetical protein
MPKNSQYGRWRRLAMQAVMWVVFGGTLALAGFVSHRKTASLEVELAEPTTFGRLKVRLPKGWDRDRKAEKEFRSGPKPASPSLSPSQPESESRPLPLIVQERDEEGRLRRELWITQERQAEVKRGPAFYLETVFLTNVPTRAFDMKTEPFNFLGSRGILIPWQGLPKGLLMEIDEELAERFPPGGLYACTVLRDGLTVTVQVRGDGAVGPTNRRLIRLVADNLRLSDEAADDSDIE